MGVAVIMAGALSTAGRCGKGEVGVSETETAAAKAPEKHRRNHQNRVLRVSEVLKVDSGG